MFTYEIGVPLNKPVEWRRLELEVENKLFRLTRVEGRWVNYVEPWRFHNWREHPEGNVSWDPLHWFEKFAEDDSATCTIYSSIFGSVRGTMMWWYIDDELNQKLFILMDPPTRPITIWEAVLTIAVALAVADMTNAEIAFESGLCGLGKGGTVEEIEQALCCHQTHHLIATAVDEIASNIRNNAKMRGVTPPI